MATGSSTQLTRQIGEHLVAAKLGRLGLFATPFAGNVPEFDLVVANASGQSLLIQVKAINGPSWQFNASTFLNIEMVGNEQIVKGKKKLKNPNLICIFVLLRDDEFYVFRAKDLQTEIAKTYKGGVRPKNPQSMHCAVWPKQLSKHRDNWPLVLESFA
ncbi:MAG: hypothetical protein C3F18_11225 [Nitrosomonadales bacterium]|nr:MAG: hypothetical protein C3F18_11225 [Nitrosomonadales bacterium]